MTDASHARAGAEATLAAQAARTAAGLVKSRARAYAKSPKTLDILCPGLSSAAPGALIAAARLLLAAERNLRRRWLGAGGEVPLINAKAALLYGRALRLNCKARKPRG
ncbi:MAG: hypothetical protein J2P49_00165 [Methylocapsa sp.]|nr:hypothetical protein [Methylocapsa sp.]